MRIVTIATAATALLPLCACGGDTEAAPTVLRVSGIPDNKITELDKQGDALAAYLSKAIGMEVRYDKANDYTAAVNGLAANKLDLVWLGGVTSVDAEQVTGGKAVLVTCRAEDLQFKSYFIANREALDEGRVTAVESLEQLKPMLQDLTFTFGDQKSTSGHIMPRHFMMQAGIDPENDIKDGAKYRLTGSHGATLEAVASGQVDAGVLNYTVWEAAEAAMKAKAPIVYVTPPYVDYCMVAHQRLGDDVIGKIRDAFVALDPGNPDHKKLLDAYSASKFVAADPVDWDGIRQVLKDLRAKGILEK